MATSEPRVASASLDVRAPAAAIFELIADPARQPEWDGNDNLGSAAAGQRVRAVGDVFTMTLSKGSVRENHVVEYEEGRRIAWKPGEVGRGPVGHLWRWELEALADGRTRVTHTYDWTDLHDQSRRPRARATTPERLAASIDRLAALAEGEVAAGEVVVNEHTGEVVRFVVETPELLRMDVTWSRPGHRALRHRHPGMEERWEVVGGRAAFEVDGVLVEAGAGSSVAAPPGRPHLAWNPTDEPVRLRIEMRPALRWAEFVRRFFAGDDPVGLLDEFVAEIELAPEPS